MTWVRDFSLGEPIGITVYIEFEYIPRHVGEGYVVFYLDDQPVANVTLEDGRATITIGPFSEPSTHYLRVYYSGDDYFNSLERPIMVSIVGASAAPATPTGVATTPTSATPTPPTSPTTPTTPATGTPSSPTRTGATTPTTEASPAAPGMDTTMIGVGVVIVAVIAVAALLLLKRR